MEPKKKKKTPERQCLGCNEHKSKREMLRVVRTPEGEVMLDFSGRKNGRGAYICRDVRCLKKARKSKRLDRSLGCEVPEEVYDAMEAELGENGEAD
ncbi:MAG: YlxR family protein [Clostridiales bacterium]|nr:YlxR family protein [Clostridiales bacterium]HOA85368.1 YlxR family protein [Bacillota bacterium]